MYFTPSSYSIIILFLQLNCLKDGANLAEIEEARRLGPYNIMFFTPSSYSIIILFLQLNCLEDGANLAEIEEARRLGPYNRMYFTPSSYSIIILFLQLNCLEDGANLAEIEDAGETAYISSFVEQGKTLGFASTRIPGIRCIAWQDRRQMRLICQIYFPSEGIF